MEVFHNPDIRITSYNVCYTKLLRYRLVDVQGIGLDPLYRRNYFFNYNYGFNYTISKSLKVNFAASRNNIVRNYLDQDGTADNTLDIWDSYRDIGDPNQFNQQITVNYDS